MAYLERECNRCKTRAKYWRWTAIASGPKPEWSEGGADANNVTDADSKGVQTYRKPWSFSVLARSSRWDQDIGPVASLLNISRFALSVARSLINSRSAICVCSFSKCACMSSGQERRYRRDHARAAVRSASCRSFAG
jgi:hypothetical protein